jgi:hypothetical protein
LGFNRRSAPVGYSRVTDDVAASLEIGLLSLSLIVASRCFGSGFPWRKLIPA